MISEDSRVLAISDRVVVSVGHSDNLLRIVSESDAERVYSFRGASRGANLVLNEVGEAYSALTVVGKQTLSLKRDALASVLVPTVYHGTDVLQQFSRGRKSYFQVDGDGLKLLGSHESKTGRELASWLDDGMLWWLDAEFIGATSLDGATSERLPLEVTRIVRPSVVDSCGDDRTLAAVVSDAYGESAFVLVVKMDGSVSGE